MQSSSLKSLTLIHSISAAIVEAAAVVSVVFSAIIMLLVNGCRLAAADVALFLSLASHLENENNEQSGEITNISRASFLSCKSKQKAYFLMKSM